jgi:helicase MOV-10
MLLCLSRFTATLLGKNNRVHKGGSRPVAITLHPQYDGYYHDVLELVFFHFDKRLSFIITRTVEATIGSREDHELLKAKEPYKRRMFTKFLPQGKIVRSSRPPVWTKSTWKVKLLGHDAPAELIKSVYGPGINPKKALAAIKAYMPPFFTENTYGAWFQVLLWLEEERVR